VKLADIARAFDPFYLPTCRWFGMPIGFGFELRFELRLGAPATSVPPLILAPTPALARSPLPGGLSPSHLRALVGGPGEQPPFFKC